MRKRECEWGGRERRQENKREINFFFLVRNGEEDGSIEWKGSKSKDNIH